MTTMDDEVIRELDVFVTDDTPLFLLQFPLKPVYADSIDISSGKFKPKHKKLELDIPFVVPENYPRENLANVPKTQKYQSSVVGLDACLGAGIIKDNAMYITPIQSVLQLRPSFKDMNSFRSEVVEQMDDDVADNEVQEGEGEGLQQVTLKRKESEKAQSSRVQSFTYLKAQEELEAWRTLTINNIGMILYP
jgi:DNA-directed RNA polymerase-3 subunit RPC5